MLSSRSAAPETASWGGIWPETPIRIAIDPNGNLIQKTENGEVWDYVWDAENQLVGVTKNSAEIATFTYDPVGRRVEKVAGGITTAWTYTGEDILRESTTDGVTTNEAHYIHGPEFDEPLAKEELATTYYHADALGSIHRLTDQAGSPVHEYKYDAWGNIELGAATSGYAYTGREWDAELELFYYRARYYDATIGRFLSEDPLELKFMLHPYAYVDGNPVTKVDPLGLVQTEKTFEVPGSDASVGVECIPEPSGSEPIPTPVPRPKPAYLCRAYAPSCPPCVVDREKTKECVRSGGPLPKFPAPPPTGQGPNDNRRPKGRSKAHKNQMRTAAPMMGLAFFVDLYNRCARENCVPTPASKR